MLLTPAAAAVAVSVQPMTRGTLVSGSSSMWACVWAWGSHRRGSVRAVRAGGKAGGSGQGRERMLVGSGGAGHHRGWCPIVEAASCRQRLRLPAPVRCTESGESGCCGVKKQ